MSHFKTKAHEDAWRTKNEAEEQVRRDTAQRHPAVQDSLDDQRDFVDAFIEHGKRKKRKRFY